MNKFLALALAAGLALSCQAFAKNSGAPLADLHAKASVTCEKCHATKTPAEGAAVGIAACAKCHGSYEALAGKTKGVDPNPHLTHQGNVRCSDCHWGHQKSVLMCNDCHKFDLKP